MFRTVDATCLVPMSIPVRTSSLLSASTLRRARRSFNRRRRYLTSWKQLQLVRVQLAGMGRRDQTRKGDDAYGRLCSR